MFQDHAAPSAAPVKPLTRLSKGYPLRLRAKRERLLRRMAYKAQMPPLGAPFPGFAKCRVCKGGFGLHQGQIKKYCSKECRSRRHNLAR